MVPCRERTFASSAASTSSLAASTVCAERLSTSTGTPARTHCRPPEACSVFGVARITPSGWSAANSWSSDAYDATP